MTLPASGIPVSPTIEALRAALNDVAADEDVREAARAVLDEYDSQVAAVRAAMEQATQRASIVQTFGQARGTLDR